MTYCLNKKSPISQTQSRLLRLLGKVLPCVTRPVVLRWSTTQVREVRVSSGEDPRPDPCVGASGMENRPQTRLADIPAAPSSAVWRQPGWGGRQARTGEAGVVCLQDTFQSPSGPGKTPRAVRVSRRLFGDLHTCENYDNEPRFCTQCPGKARKGECAGKGWEGVCAGKGKDWRVQGKAGKGSVQGKAGRVCSGKGREGVCAGKGRDWRVQGKAGRVCAGKGREGM